MNMLKSLFAAYFFFAAAAQAEDKVEIKSLAEDGVSPPASIEALSWMVGYWEGEGLGGNVAELVAPPAGGQMMASFYHVKEDGELNFYEFYTFAEIDGSLVLRIKHFSPDLVGWEEKDKFVEFPLVTTEENAVYFDGLTFAMTGPDTMQAAVNISEQGSAYFTYQRTPLE